MAKVISVSRFGCLPLVLYLLAACTNAIAANVVPGSIPASFDVTLTGSAGYSIPIKIAPGAAGTEPKLQLSYDSQAPAGVLGAGWYISGLSVITRGPKDHLIDGQASGVTLSDNDALYLDGQRIIPVSPASGAGASRRREFRKINDDQTRIIQFGPDLEHSFFLAQTKGGVTILFGNAENVSGSPGDSVVRFGDGRVLGFAESLAIDTAGNTIEFHYDQNQNGDYNISHIDYTGHGHLGEDGKLVADKRPFASVTFTYTKKTSRSLETFVGGHSLVRDRQLTDIVSCVSETRLQLNEICVPTLRPPVTRQVTHYKFDYDATPTANRFLLKSLRFSGEDDSVELPPTVFSYNTAGVGWTRDPFTFPSSAVLAQRSLGAAYRFAHFAPGANSSVDLLFSVQKKTGRESFAFLNDGLNATDPAHSLWKPAPDFAPPIPFVDESGADLGAIVVDLNGDGRADLLQSNQTGGVATVSAHIAGATKFEPATGYSLPFVVSRDGKVVASYRFGHWTGGAGPDLIYESEGKAGFLKNAGAAIGWQPQPATFSPPVPLDSRSHMVDLACDQSKPAFIGVKPDATGKPRWLAFRFGAAGWEEETRSQFLPPFPPETDPEAVRELKIGVGGVDCDGLVVAIAAGLHRTYVASKSGWKLVAKESSSPYDQDKAPPFDLVDAQGHSSGAIVADVDGDGRPDVVAHRQLADGRTIMFAYRQTATGWISDLKFRPPLLGVEGGRASYMYVGDVDGQPGADIVFPDETKVLPDHPAWQAGQIFTSDGLQFVPHLELGGPLAFARKDKQDLGVRFIDLHGTGLPDIIFSRRVVENGKTTLLSGAYRNTGTGWRPEPGDCSTPDKQNMESPTGLCPPVPFAGDEITGNPVQFLDLNGDGFADMIYSYRDKGNNVLTKIYLNTEDKNCVSNGLKDVDCRKWTELRADTPELGKLVPPADVFPLASFGIGDMGVRFTRFDANRLGVLVGFRGAGAYECRHWGPKHRRYGCAYGVGPFVSKAFVQDGQNWRTANEYKPPVPFVTQYDSSSGRSIDLSIQIVDVVGNGLPALVASYTDPIIDAQPWPHQNATTNHVWTNVGKGWDGNNGLAVPYALDAAMREPKTLVQIVDLNADGLPDIVMTKGDCANCSRTWLATGAGWVERPAWRIPADAISNRDGDPGFRLVDTKGDGYLDVLWMRTKPDGSVDKGLFLNNGTDWSTKGPDTAVPALPFADKDGVERGVRLLSVTGTGLTDIIQGFAGESPVVERNNSRRADILASITEGYGLTTRVFYATLLEPDGSDCPDPKSNCRSGVPEGGPLGPAAYVKGPPDAFPLVAPIPTMYVVRRAEVDEGDNRVTRFFYRYGGYRVDSQLTRSLGFKWRESLNTASNLLVRTDFIQDARLRSGVRREATCLVMQDKLVAWPANQTFPEDLCPGGSPRSIEWGQKIKETRNCWLVFEGDLNSAVNEVLLPGVEECGQPKLKVALSGPIIRQSFLSKLFSITYELDGRTITSGTDSFEYESSGGVLQRFGNVQRTVSALDDGTSVTTVNVYSDDPASWFLGRLTRSTVTKLGDPVFPGSKDRKAETRRTCFSYDGQTGLLATETVNCDHVKAVEKSYHRDDYGNVVTKTTSASREASQTTTIVYDKLGRFILSTIDPLGHLSQRINSPTNGLPLTSIDPNGLKSSVGYDSFGRIASTTNPDGVVGTTEMIADRAKLPKWNGTTDIASGLPISFAYAVRTQVGPQPAGWTLYDRKGRQVRTVSEAFTPDGVSQRFVFKDVEYDAAGYIARSSLPHEPLSAALWTTNEYDGLKRVCSSIAPNGLRTETLYTGLPEGGGRVVVVVDPKKQLSETDPEDASKVLLSCGRSFPAGFYNKKGLERRTSSRTNMRKLLTEARDALGAVKYEYDAGGRITKMVGPTGAITTYLFNELGNKIEANDPDLGTWHYSYDAFGRIRQQIDAKGQLSTMEYDLLSRPKLRTLPDVTTTWTYDTANMGVGKPAVISNSNGYSESFVYDANGRISRDVVSIGTEQFVTSTEYDALGRVEKIYYPSSFAVRNRYDRKGFLVSVSGVDNGTNYWVAKDIDIFGHVVKEAYGNGVTTTRHFSPGDLRPKEFRAEGAKSGTVLDLSLNYDLIGNLRSRDESVEQKHEQFGYDELDRLTSVTQNNGTSAAVHFDPAGRITFRDGPGHYTYVKGERESDGIYAKPFHAVLETRYGRRHAHFAYDLNGNMISSPEGHFEYTSDNHLSLLYGNENKWSRFDYGPAGDRFRQTARDGWHTVETIYTGAFERITAYSGRPTNDYVKPFLTSGSERLTRYRHYLSNGQGVFAVVESQKTYANTLLDNPNRKPGLVPIGETLTREAWYLHTDQLGSILRITDQNGRIRERLWYEPWGHRSIKSNDQPGRGEAQRLAHSWTRGFTGHEHLPTFSLVHMNGRVFNPMLAVFLSVDPVNQMITDTQSGNGYAYARGNPLRYIDPSGTSWGSFWRAVTSPFRAVGDAIGAIGRGIGHFASEVGKWFAENWRTVVIVAAVITVTVLTAGAGATLAGAILSGMAAGATGGALGAALYGGSFEDILLGAVKGAVIGGISGAAFYGVGSYFTAQPVSATTEIESIAAHGVVGGAKEAVEGGNFWKGFVATAATKATSIFGPRFDGLAANTARAAVVGGTVAQISGGKFANGAILGAFSYAYNDAMHPDPYANDRIDPDYTIESVAAAAVGIWGGVVGLYELGAELLEGMWAEEGALQLETAETWGNPKSLADHFERHGPDFGAQTPEEYATKASDFLQQSQRQGLPTRIDPNGTIRVYDPNTNTFGSYNPNGTTKTFFKPESPSYWSRQPGVSP